VGRLDEQVKIRGHRVEPAEVRAALAAHPDVLACVALAICPPDHRSPHLVAAVVAGQGIDERLLREWLGERLPSHMIPRRIALVDEIPLTANGKVDSAAVLAELDRVVDARASGLDENVIVQMWRELIGAAPAPTDDFFECGGDSILALQFRDRVARQTGFLLPLEALLGGFTIASVTSAFERALGTPALPAADADSHGTAGTAVPLTAAQRGLWLLHRLEPESSAYNVAGRVDFVGRINIEMLRRAIENVVARHDALRMCFERGRAVATISDAVAKLEYAAVGGAAATLTKVRDNVERPFDLTAPPVRFTLVDDVEAERSTLVLVFHHSIFDAASWSLLLNDLAAAYAADEDQSAASGLTFPFAAFCRWYDGYLSERGVEDQVLFWADRWGNRSGAGPAPSRRPRHTRLGHASTVQIESLDPAALRSAARSVGASPFMVTLAVFAIFASIVEDERSPTVAVPMTLRTHPDFVGIVGNLLNVVPVTVDLSPRTRFEDLVRRLRADAAAWAANRDAPLDRVVAARRRKPDAGPIRAMLSYFRGADPDLTFGGLRGRFRLLPAADARFPFVLNVSESSAGVVADLEFTEAGSPGPDVLLRRLFAECLCDVTRSVAAITSAAAEGADR
jgi:hypothetical protein